MFVLSRIYFADNISNIYFCCLWAQAPSRMIWRPLGSRLRIWMSRLTSNKAVIVIATQSRRFIVTGQYRGGKIAPLMWIAHWCLVWAAVGGIWNEEKEKPDVFARSAQSYSQDRLSRKSFGRARRFAHKLKFVFLILLLLVWLSIEEPVKSYNIMRIQSRRFTFREKRSHLDNLLYSGQDLPVGKLLHTLHSMKTSFWTKLMAPVGRGL